MNDIKHKIFFVVIILLLYVNLKASDCIPTYTLVNLYSQDQVDSFPIKYPGCTNVKGMLHIRTLSSYNRPITNLDSLKYLTKFDGVLTIEENDSLVSLEGLKNIDTFNVLNLSYNVLLPNLDGLRNMKYANKLSIGACFSITDITSLRSLEKVNHEFIIAANRSLLHLKGLVSLKSLSQVYIRNNSLLVDLDGLQSINTLNHIEIDNNNSLKSLNGLNNLKNVSNNIIINNNQSLLNLEGLNNVEDCEIANIIILSNASMQNLKGLDKLKSVHGLVIGYNVSLTSLFGMFSLNKVNFFDLYNNESLENINDLDTLIKVRNQIYVKDNPLLSCCLTLKKILEHNPTLQTIDIRNNLIGCNSIAEVMALAPTATCCISSIIERHQTICQDDSIKIGIHSYKTTGVYRDTFKIVMGCDSIVITNLTVRPKSYTIKTKNLCNGQQFILSNGKVITTSGIYKDTIPNFCDSIIEYNVNFLNNIITNQSVTICQGNIFILPNGKVVKSTGIYRDTLQASFGCDSIVNTQLTVQPYLQSSQNISICKGLNYTLPSGKNVNQTGVYKDTIQNSNGCDSIVITNLTVTLPIPFAQNVAICEGQQYTLPSNKKVSTAGVYIDTIHKNNTCDSIIITTLALFPNTFVIQLKPEDTIDAGSSIELHPIDTAQTSISWNWSPLQYLSCNTCEKPIASPLEQTTYTVRVKAQNGCEDTASTRIIVRNTEVFVPTAFSPNNDGINDELNIFVSNPVSFNLKVYNRWSQLVFESNNVSNRWDGTSKGEVLPIDGYSYNLDVVLPNGRIIHKQGLVALLR